MPLPALLLAIAELAPIVMRAAGKDSEASVVESGVALARRLSGKEDPDAALEAIRANPEMLLKFQLSMNEVTAAELAAETERLKQVNETMRAEIQSGDPFVRRARPGFIWAMSASWSIQMLAISISIVSEPDKTGQLISAASGLTGMWAVALAVIGVYVKARSDDKKLAAGESAPSMLESVGALFKRG